MDIGFKLLGEIEMVRNRCMRALEMVAGITVEDKSRSDLVMEKPRSRTIPHKTLHTTEVLIAVLMRRQAHQPENTKNPRTPDRQKLVMVLKLKGSPGEWAADAWVSFWDENPALTKLLENFVAEIIGNFGGYEWYRGKLKWDPLQRWPDLAEWVSDDPGWLEEEREPAYEGNARDAVSEAEQAEETPASTEQTDGVKKARISQATKALAEKVLELRKSNAAMSKSEVADWIEAHYTDDEKRQLKRGWRPLNPITEDDVKNAWSRMQEIDGWLAWSEGKLPVRD